MHLSLDSSFDSDLKISSARSWSSVLRWRTWLERSLALGKLEGRVVLLIIIWYAVSAANNILNKLFLVKESNLHLSSLALMFAQTVIALAFASVLFALKVDRFTPIPPRQVARSIVPLAVGFIITVVLTYTALENISVSLSATIKGLAPLFNVLIMRVVYNERHSWRTHASLLVVMLGVILTSLTDLEFHFWGATAATVSTFVLVVQNILSKHLLSTDGIAAPVVQFYVQATSASMLLALLVLLERRDLTSLLVLLARPRAALGVLLNGLCFFAHVAVALRVLEHVSALTYAVANTVKRVVVIAGAVATFGPAPSLLNLLGMSIALGGGLLYSYARMRWEQRHHYPHHPHLARARELALPMRAPPSAPDVGPAGVAEAARGPHAGPMSGSTVSVAAAIAAATTTLYGTPVSLPRTLAGETVVSVPCARGSSGDLDTLEGAEATSTADSTSSDETGALVSMPSVGNLAVLTMRTSAVHA